MAVFRAIVSGTMFGQTCQNVLHFAKDVTVQNDALFLAQSLRDDWCVQIRFRMGNEANFTTVEVRELTNPNTVPAVVSVNLSGTAGGIPNTFPFAAYKIKLSTQALGRVGRGRFFVWGIGPGSMQAGILLPGVITAWEGTLATLKQKYGTAPTSGYSLVIAPRNNPTNFKLVTDMRIAPIPGVMRRRNIGVGR